MENVSMFWMYIIAMLPNIKNAFEFFTAFFGLIILGYVILHAMMKADGEKIKTKVYYIIVPAFILFLSGAIMIPNYQQLAFIVGGHWAINNEDLREMPDNVAQVVNGYLEQLNDEMVNNKGGE